MRPFSSQVVLAFDASSVSAALIGRGLRRARVMASAAERLSEGALAPSALGPNLRDRGEVSRAIGQALGSLGSRTSHATLVLPHGAARVAVFDLPRGQDAMEYARFRLASGLPYPLAEATVDFLPLAGGRLLAAAIRRDVVAEYEAAATAAGITRRRVDLAPLAVAAGAGLLPESFAAATIFLALGDTACALFAYEGGRLLAVRVRRRDPGEGDAERLRLEALRTADHVGLAGEPELVVAGAGARGLLDHWAAAGQGARLLSLFPAAFPLHEAATRPWLAAALA